MHDIYSRRAKSKQQNTQCFPLLVCLEIYEHSASLLKRLEGALLDDFLDINLGLQHS